MNNSCLLFFLIPFLLVQFSGIPHTSAQSTTPSYTPSAPGVIWATWGGQKNDQGNAIATDGQGNIYIAGSTDSFGYGTTKALLLKYSANGIFLWVKTWSATIRDYGRAVAVDSLGRIYLAGDSLGLGIFLAKFDPNGYLIWQQNWSGNGTEHASGMALDQGGDVYVTGATTSLGVGNSELFLLKFDTTGALMWQRSSGGNDTDMGEGVALDSSGMVYVTGSTRSLGPNQAAALLKFNSAGSLLWQRAWNDSTSDLGLSVALDIAGNVYIAGSTKSSGAETIDALIMKMNSTGNILWQKTWGNSNATIGEGIAIDQQGNLAVTGFTNSYSPTNLPTDNAFILKLNSTGELLSNVIVGPTGAASLGLGVTMDQSGNLVAIGFVSSLPPSFYAANTSLGVANYSTATRANTSDTPDLPVGTPNGVVGSVTGSRDQLYNNYNGNDVLLLKSFASPTNYTITFNGGLQGIAQFDGRYPGTNRALNITEGTYVATEFLLLCDCYQVGGWNSTGGVILASDPTGFQVVINLVGSGTLTPPGWAMHYYPYYKPHPVLPGGLLLTAFALFLPAIFYLRRKGVKKQNEFSKAKPTKCCPIRLNETFPHPLQTTV